MPRTLSPEAIAALSSGNPKFVVLVSIETPSVTIRMTSDTFDTPDSPAAWDDSFLWDDSATWDDGGSSVYYKTGTLGSISRVRENSNPSDSEISISFSGVDIPTLALCSSPDFINSPVVVYLQISNGSTSGRMVLFSGYTSGAPNISYSSESSIMVKCAGKFAALDRPRTERYADQDQQRKYPGDIGMQYASTVSSRDVIWPAASWFKNQG